MKKIVCFLLAITLCIASITAYASKEGQFPSSILTKVTMTNCELYQSPYILGAGLCVEIISNMSTKEGATEIANIISNACLCGKVYAAYSTKYDNVSMYYYYQGDLLVVQYVNDTISYTETDISYIGDIDSFMTWAKSNGLFDQSQKVDGNKLADTIVDMVNSVK